MGNSSSDEPEPPSSTPRRVQEVRDRVANTAST
ncbi:hypothetical protein AVEN_53512-1, partial [Araneus ventricosus]